FPTVALSFTPGAKARPCPTGRNHDLQILRLSRGLIGDLGHSTILFASGFHLMRPKRLIAEQPHSRANNHLDRPKSCVFETKYCFDRPQSCPHRRTNSGSLAMFAAIRRASWPVGFRFAERAAKLFDEGAGCQQV